MKIKVHVDAPLQGISLSETQTKMNVGDTKQLEVKYNPTDTTDDRTVSWQSSNPSIVTVDNMGNLEAKALGSATITAKVGAYTTSCNVTVVEPIERIEFENKTLELNQGDKGTLNVKYFPENAEPKNDVKFSSSDETVITINSSGGYEAVGAGTATITANADGKMATCEVSVKIPISRINLNAENVTLWQGENYALEVTPFPEDTTEELEVQWESSDEKVAMVNAQGVITAKGEGEAVITAKHHDVVAQCTVTVKEIKLQDIYFNNTSYELQKGDVFKLTVNYLPEDTTADKTILWNSSNPKVITIDGEGNISAVGAGKATITARMGDKIAKCEVTVKAQLQGISLDTKQVIINKNDRKTLNVIYEPSDTTDDKTVSWTSSNNEIVEVMEDGTILGKKEGTAIITAKVGDKIDTCKVVVLEIKLDSISLSNTNITIKKGQTQTLTVLLNPSNTTDNTQALWLSQNQAIATVEDGTVKGMEVGETLVVATVGNHIASCSVKVVGENEEIPLPFTDVKKEDWYYSAVKYNYGNNMIKGLNDTTFAPNEKLTRGMLVTILHRMEGSPYVAGTSKFLDVQNNKEYYYVAVKWATQNNIVSGYDNGNFGPNDNITREQLAVILNRYCKYKGKYKAQANRLNQFKDANKISDFAKWEMQWATGVGVITGSNGNLNPQGTATRAEVASMLYKYCLNVK